MPVKYVGAFPPNKGKQPGPKHLKKLPKQPLSAWLKEHKEQLSPAFVDAMMAD